MITIFSWKRLKRHHRLGFYFSDRSILITQSQQKIECYRRELSGFWSEQAYKAEEVVEFRSVNYRCPMDDIYRKVPGLN